MVVDLSVFLGGVITLVGVVAVVLPAVTVYIAISTSISGFSVLGCLVYMLHTSVRI